MKIVDAVELQPVDVPIDSIIRVDGSFDIDEGVRKYFDIDYRPRSDRLRLVAGGRIGLIPINDRLAVDVKPKFPISNLVHIISKSGDEISTLDFFNRDYNELPEAPENLFLFFSRSLSKELQKLSTEGVFRDYSQIEANLSSPKGRINFGRTLKKNWSRGNYSHVVVDYFEFAADNPFNRLIKFTLWYCLNHLSSAHPEERRLIEIFSYYYDILNSVPVDMQRKFIDVVDELLADDKVPVLRSYYINISRLCKLIINDMSVSLSTIGEDISLLSFCIDMAATFERYLLNVLRQYQETIGPGVIVLDGNDDGEQPLFLDRAKPEAKPDYVLMQGGENKVLIDAKYKSRLKESDRYQIIAHSLSYGVKVAVLLSPCVEGRDSGLSYYGEIGNNYKLRMYEYFFDMGCVNLTEEEGRLVEALSELCN